MAEQESRSQAVRKFAGIEVPPELTRMNFFFLYLLTLVMGMFMSIAAVVQPAFLKDVICIDQQFAGSINGFLQNMSQVATLLFVGVIGVLSDKTGRKILVFFGFVLLAISFYFFGMSATIAEALHVPAAGAAKICAWLNFVPAKAAEFEPFAAGLLVTYLIRFFIGVGLILGYPQFITMVADYTYEKDRGKGMAYNGMSMGLASILVFGIFGAIVRSKGVIAAIDTAAIISITAAVVLWFFLKDRMPESLGKKSGLRAIWPTVKVSPTLRTSYLCSLITRADVVVLATFLVAWGVKVSGQFNMNAGEATMKALIPLMVMGVLSFAAYPAIGILLDKWGRVPTMLVCLLTAGIGLMIINVSPSPFSPIMYVAVVFIAFGMSGSVAGANTMATDVSPKGMVGAVLGGLNTMQPIGILFFLAAGGYVFDAFGPGWSFGLKGVADLLLFAVFFIFRKSISQEIEEKTSLLALTFAMEWEDEAKKMLDKVPAPFRQKAVSGTEEYARKHSHDKITPAVMEEYRKELGM